MADETLDLHSLTYDVELTVRDAAKREMDLRLLPWDTVIETTSGTEEFKRGAFADTDPERVILWGPEHEVSLGLGQDGGVVPTRKPAGRGIAFAERDDAPYLTVRVAKTSGGDDILALAEDGLVRGVSVEFTEVPGGTIYSKRGGRRHATHVRSALTGVSTTYRPAYGERAAVVAVRSEGEPDVPEPIEAPVPVAAAPVAFDYDKLAAAVTQARSVDAEAIGKVLDRLEKVEEQARANFTIPAGEPEPPKPHMGQWMEIAIKLLSGERIADQQMRTVADFVTTDNAGVVPDFYESEIIGVISRQRPFLESTRRIPTPASGMTIRFPKITQRPTTAVQSSEKTELSSTKTIITTVGFDAITIGGYGDLSLQLLKRSDPSFLSLYLELLGEAYGIDADEQALRELFDLIGGVGGAGSLDPENLSLGAAFEASYDTMKSPPDTIWLSSEAVGAFIDAKQGSGGANVPMYSQIGTNFTAGSQTGLISGLRPIHTPALDTHGCFALVGPSRGFAWAEDGTYTLQVDVPAKAGRDVGLVGMLWAMPVYPDAFTAYNVAS